MKKTSSLRVLDYLEHILEAVKRIDEYTDDMVELTFLKNKLVQDGVIRNLGYAKEQFIRLCLQDMIDRAGIQMIVDIKPRKNYLHSKLGLAYI